MKNISPSVTVVMPIRNEGGFIKESLGAVLNQDYPKDLTEIILADGMSTDQTRDIIRELQRSHPNIKLIDNPKKIVASGLNEAIRQAKGDIIVRVDGHCIIASDYVSQSVVLLEKTNNANVGGRIVAVGMNFFGKAVSMATSFPFGIGNARFHYSDKEEYADTVFLGVWHKAAFEMYGFFDEELVRNQDDEFNYRIREKGGKILLSPKITSRYYVRGNPGALWRQYFQYGYWKIRVMQKHPGQMKLRQFVPPLFVSAVAVSTGFFLLGKPAPFLIISGAYLATNLSVSAYLVMKNSWKYFVLLPVIFSILHVSYGAGFLAGLCRFSDRWVLRE